MSIISNQTVIPENLLEDLPAFSGFVGEQVRRLVEISTTQYRSEVDLSTLRISLRRDSFGLSLKASALELVEVGSRWVRNGAPGSKQGPFKVLAIDHRVDQTYPWITVEDGWGGRLDYFHRDYTRYPEPILPKVGSYWIMTAAIGVGTKWRCAVATNLPKTGIVMKAVHGDGDAWSGTVADFNNCFRAASE